MANNNISLNNDLAKDISKEYVGRSELERTISAGIRGTPELKHEEKMSYLGEFRERVLMALTKSQVMESHVYPEIRKSLRDPRASKMLLHGDIAYRYRDKYQKIANQLAKPYTIVYDPQLHEEIGLVIAGDQAIDAENIFP